MRMSILYYITCIHSDLYSRKKTENQIRGDHLNENFTQQLADFSWDLPKNHRSFLA